ncbi:ATPase [[Bacillus] enclensis]|uniref:ATPase n=1 Tax=[Bacillus] enclensis TaxID=1402860 RepID=UPI0018DB6C3C|nr:ATPase [[Bacillus] enclensis]MBH9964845.1 ATPase [[Bacillus] enclensis]
MDIFLISTIASIATVIIFSLIFKNKTKIDKGFKMNYFGLSYRRKMIRTLLSFPLIVLITIFLMYIDLSKAIKISFVLFILVAFAIQFFYNYYMWKKKES